MHKILVKAVLKLFLKIDNKYLDSIIDKVFKYKKYYFVDLNHEKFTNEWDENCKGDEEARFIYLEPSFLNGNGTGLKKTCTYKTYIKTFKNVELTGESSLLLLKNNKAYYDVKQIDFNNNYLFTDRMITVNNKKSLFVKKGTVYQKIPRAISLICSYSNNYFHFLYEVIAKFYYINNCNISLSVPILVDEKIEKITQYIELLNLFNTQKRKVIYLERNRFTEVKELIKLPSTLLAPPNFKNLKYISMKDYRYNVDSLNYLRKTLLKNKEYKETPKRIFLSRKKASSRRRYNEGEVLECLKKYNFKEVFTERLTVAEQVNLFYNAKFVVGATGAAVSNILFCNDKCEIICLTNYNLPLGIFSSIGAFIGIKMNYLYDTTKMLNNNSRLHDDFNVDIECLNTFIQERVNN